MDSIRRIHKDVEKRIEIRNVRVGGVTRVSYPSEWFNSNPGAKPTINIVENKWTVKQLVNTIFAGLRDGSLDPRIVVVFLVVVFKAQPGKLNADWNSFGVTIGKKDKEITIADLVNFITGESTVDIREGSMEPSDSITTKLVIVLCAIYRIIQIHRADHRKKEIANVLKFITGLKGEAIDLEVAYKYFQQWPAYRPYVQLMGCIDMFLNEFPLHKYSQASMGTSASRFKDCSALVSTKTILEYLGLTFTQFAEWIWTSRCADQFVQVTKGGEEMDDPRSYAMYFMSLGLSHKSPYSITVNSDLHLLYHTIGVSGGLECSINARFVGYPAINDVIFNAIVIHYVLRTGVPDQVEELDEGLVNADGYPSDKNPKSWLAFVRKGKIPKHMQMKARKQWARCANSPRQSIGLYLYRRSLVPLSDDD